MNRISEAIVRDYRSTRMAFEATGHADLEAEMARMREAVKVLWPGFVIDLDAAADAVVVTD